MSDSRRGDWSDGTQTGSEYPPNIDPAYSGQYPGQYWGPTGPTDYGAGYGVPAAPPTDQLPSYWQQGAGYSPGPPPPAPPPPQPPKSPRWLWIAAAVAVLVVAGLVLALVIVSSSSKESTTVAPLPQATPTSPRPTTTTRIPTATRAPIPLPLPIPRPEPTPRGTPGETAPGPTGTETVVYNVTGEGRAINITYVDTGGIMQTEFNVALPWNKQVSLAAPAKRSASVAIVNVGRDVTCSVSVDGAQVRQRTGRGLTICTGAG
ncbi:MAG: hypothetical protein K0U67_01505 [Actinomycetia bacterium]|nr:hypothetical protein [Actinomycetes bacterium]